MDRHALDSGAARLTLLTHHYPLSVCPPTSIGSVMPVTVTISQTSNSKRCTFRHFVQPLCGTIMPTSAIALQGGRRNVYFCR